MSSAFADTPFNKELFVAGFVEDSMLDIIQGSDQVGGAFIVLVYHDVGQRFKYYLMVCREDVYLINTVQKLSLFITLFSEPPSYLLIVYHPASVPNNINKYTTGELLGDVWDNQYGGCLQSNWLC